MRVTASVVGIMLVFFLTVTILGKTDPLNALKKVAATTQAAQQPQDNAQHIVTPKPSKKDANADKASKNASSKGVQSLNNTISTSYQPSQFASTPSFSVNYAQKPDGGVGTDLWNAELGNNNGWGNNEVESYTSSPDNLRVQNGALTIEAKKSGSSYTSARINTKNNFDFMYGKIDVVAKMPVGKGVWPAIWFWPTDSKYSNQAVAPSEKSMTWLNNGEIDLLEGSAWGDSDFTGSVHSLGHYPGHSVRTGKVSVPTASTAYHTYSLAWTPNSLDLLVDGVSFKHVTNTGAGFKDWPYDQRYHLILNIAMGGSMSQGLVSPQYPLGIDDSSAPWVMNVKSITYYPLAN